MNPEERLLSSALDCLTAVIEAMEAAGESWRPGLLRKARALIEVAAMDRPAQVRSRRWWQRLTWRRSAA